ncbi:hypothetical protein [Sporomusa sp.]|uniref:hypothetical protein n=1 Tax=Sporomusa sp. TaxID=2078658 RepID=UPI002C357439|nr:hypothetical protein [Sporomusa sp.]HWR07616.1 hypothetical protein [Sporomusa sp.]
MEAKRKLLIMKMDLLDDMREIDAIQKAVAQKAVGLVEVSVVDCEQPEDILAAATANKPNWVHIVGRSNDKKLIFSGGKNAESQVDRIRLVKNLREAAPTLTLLTLNSKLNNRDLGNMGQLYAMIGMENGYNPLASRLFMPRFYVNICAGMPLALAAKAAIEGMQQEVVQHGGIPSMCFSHTIDPETFTLLPRETVMN